jgi:hypothetical protein
MVVQGEYVLEMDGKRVAMMPGEEAFVRRQLQS